MVFCDLGKFSSRKVRFWCTYIGRESWGKFLSYTGFCRTNGNIFVLVEIFQPQLLTEMERAFVHVLPTISVGDKSFLQTGAISPAFCQAWQIDGKKQCYMIFRIIICVFCVGTRNERSDLQSAAQYWFIPIEWIFIYEEFCRIVKTYNLFEQFGSDFFVIELNAQKPFVYGQVPRNLRPLSFSECYTDATISYVMHWSTRT